MDRIDRVKGNANQNRNWHRNRNRNTQNHWTELRLSFHAIWFPSEISWITWSVKILPPRALFPLCSSLFVVPDLDLLFSLISLLESSWHTVSAEKSTTPLSQYSKQTDTRAHVVHVRTCVCAFVCVCVCQIHTHTRTYTKRLIDVLYIEHFETNWTAQIWKFVLLFPLIFLKIVQRSCRHRLAVVFVVVLLLFLVFVVVVMWKFAEIVYNKKQRTEGSRRVCVGQWNLLLLARLLPVFSFAFFCLSVFQFSFSFSCRLQFKNKW